MPRKSFFRSYGNKSAKSSPEWTTKQEQCTTQTQIQTAAMTSWTEAALEKANMAVLYDFTGAPKQALDAYNEAIALLNKVFESADNCIDQTRLRKIYDSYISRISILTQQLDNNELDPTPSISIPVAQLSQESAFLEPSMKSQRRPPSLNLTDSRTDHDPSQPACPRSFDSPCYLNSNIHHDSVPPIPDKSQPKALPPKSPSGSLFGSMFLKKQTSKSHIKTPTQSHSMFSMSSPSKSTPTLSMNQPTMPWKKQSSKDNHRYSTELGPTDTESLSFSCKIELPSLSLPDVETPKEDDYFDLQSTMETKNLLYSKPETMLTSMLDLHQKDANENNKCRMEKEGNRLGGSHENAGNFHGNDDTATKKGDNDAAMTRERSFSSSSSNNTITTTKHQPQLTSSASSTLTCNSSIYSPTSSSFYSSTYTGLDEDALSPISSKHLPPLPNPLLLLDIHSDNSTSSFFGGSNEQAVGTLAKFLAESAATMPDRSHRTNGTKGPSIAVVIEETEPELSSSLPSSTVTATATLATTLPVNPHDSQQQLSPIELSRSASSRSVSSVKSRDSSHRRSSSSKRNKKSFNDDSPTTSPTPTPSNSAKTISFWSKRSTSSTKSTKQKAIATLPPLYTCHSTDDSSSYMLLSPPIGSTSQPSTPKSATGSVDLTLASPRTSSSSSTSKRLIVHPLQLPSHAFGAHAMQIATNKGIDVSITMKLSTMNKNNKQPKLMARLLQSMEQGGYITDRIHAPKQLWCQKQVRLPAIDIKISTCEQLVTVLERMHALSQLLDQLHRPQQDITTEALHMLGRLEHLLDNIKHHSVSPPPRPTTTSHQPTAEGKLSSSSQHELYSKSTTTTTTISSFKDPMTALSGKLSKSVERMKIDTKSSEERMHAYRSTLIRLFNLASIFDAWRDLFTALLGKVSMDKASIYDHLLQKTMMCTGTFHTVICSFVMQDLYILMDKWLKRNRDWLLD